MRGFVADLRSAGQTMRWTLGTVVPALVSFALGLAAAVAVLGLLRPLSLWPPRVLPGIAVRSIPFVDWLHAWTPRLRTPARIQADGLGDVLQAQVALGVLVFAIGAVQASIALAARAHARRYEVALRAAVGAPRARLVRHALAEAAFFAGAAIGAGAWLGGYALDRLRAGWPGVLSGAVDHRAGVLVALLALVLTTALFLGPALRMLRRGWILDAVSPGARSNPGGNGTGGYRALVIAQLAAAITLLTGAGLVLRYAAPPRGAGVSAAAPVQRLVVAVDASPAHAADRARAYERAVQRLGATAGVVRAAIASPGAVVGLGPMDRVWAECGLCGWGGMWLPVYTVFTQVHAVGPGFFDTVGVPVLQGTEFRMADAAGNVIVNRTMAELGFMGRSPLGKRILVGPWPGRSYRVVGVVEDIPRVGLGKAGGPASGPGTPGYATTAMPAIYLSAMDHPPSSVDLVVHAAGPADSVAHAIPRALAGLELRWGPPESLARRWRETNAPIRWFGATAAFLAALALVLAIHGLYTLLRFTIVVRRSEIGIRRAVGASRRAILLMILGETASLLARGAALGLFGAVLLARVLRLLFVGVPTLDLRVSAVAIGLLGAATFLGALLPARAAARLDPAAIMHE